MDSKKEPFAGPRPPEAKASGPVYRLRAQHVLSDGRLLETGTIVGADQEVTWDGPPTNQMEGVNDAGKAEVNKVHQRLYGADAPWHDPKFQRDPAEDVKAQEQQQREEKEAAPVSHAQAVEHGKDWEGRPDPVVQARVSGVPSPATVAPTIGGQPSGPGVAQPKINETDVRPERPLEEQLPKS